MEVVVLSHNMSTNDLNGFAKVPKRKVYSLLTWSFIYCYLRMLLDLHVLAITGLVSFCSRNFKIPWRRQRWNLCLKGKFVFFLLYRAYSTWIIWSKASELFWIWILKNHIQIQREKEIRHQLFPSPIKLKTRHFHVVVVLWRQRNIQKSVLHVQSARLYDHHLIITTIFFRPKRKTYWAIFLSWRRRWWDHFVVTTRILWSNGGRINGVPLFSLPLTSWHLKLPNSKRLPSNTYPNFAQQMWFLW